MNPPPGMNPVASAAAAIQNPAPISTNATRPMATRAQTAMRFTI